MWGWMSIVSAGLLAAVVSKQGVPSFLNVGLVRPVFFLSLVLMYLVFLSAVWSKSTYEEIGQRLVRLFPWALLIGIVISWVGLWNDGSGLSVMSPVDFGLYVLTLGFWPLKTGPEAFIRATATALPLLLTWSLWQETRNAKRSFLVGLVAWGGTVLLLGLPSLVAYVLAAFDSVFVIRHAQDAWNILVRSHLNSYWSTFQSDRFPVGIGQQQETTMALVTSVWFFLLSLIFSMWILLKRGILDIKKDILQSDMVRWFLFVSPILLGLLLGFHQQRWNGDWVDGVAMLLFIVICLAWFFDWRGEGIEEKGIVLKSILLIGAFLLGWPVFLGAIVLVVMTHLARSETWGWWRRLEGRAAITVGLAITLTFLGTAFAVRGFILPANFSSWSLAWGIVAVAIQLLQSLKIETINIRILLGIVIVAGAASTLLVHQPIMLAFVALLVVFLVWFQKYPEKWQRWAPLSSAIFFWATFLLAKK